MSPLEGSTANIPLFAPYSSELLGFSVSSSISLSLLGSEFHLLQAKQNFLVVGEIKKRKKEKEDAKENEKEKKNPRVKEKRPHQDF